MGIGRDWPVHHVAQSRFVVVFQVFSNLKTPRSIEFYGAVIRRLDFQLNEVLLIRMTNAHEMVPSQ